MHAKYNFKIKEGIENINKEHVYSTFGPFWIGLFFSQLRYVFFVCSEYKSFLLDKGFANIKEDKNINKYKIL